VALDRRLRRDERGSVERGEAAMRSIRRSLGVVAAVVLLAALSPTTALAAPPPNDSEAGAVEITALPFVDEADTSQATSGGPRVCTNVASVFYSFSPEESVRVQIDLIGSDYDTTLGVYRYTASGDRREVTCNDDRFGLDSGVRFRARAGTTYYVIVGRCCGFQRSGGPGGGSLVLTATEVVDADLEYNLDVTGGTVDAETGIATLTGTVTCSERSVGWREGTLRQVRQGIFVARGYLYLEAVCTPGAPAEWSAEIDTETGIAFGPGSASVVSSYQAATDGWRDNVFDEDVADETITLT
jgi:hypothetical protein